MPKEYDRVLFRGKPTDQRTAVMARLVEKKLGITFTCWQGSYSTSVSASGGTHDKGGVLDLNTPGDPQRIVRQLRNQGFAAWYRTPAQGFDPHIHAVDIGNQRLAYTAALQVNNYQSGGSGLWPLTADNDPQAYRPTNLTYEPHVTADGFNYDKWQAAQTLRQRIADRAARIKELLRSQRADKRKLDKLS